MEEHLTTQSTAEGPINPDDQLAITLMCLTCERFRTFVVSANFAMLNQGEHSAFELVSTCMVCHTRVGMRLGFHPASKGFTGTPVSMEGRQAHVGDDVGMKDALTD